MSARKVITIPAEPADADQLPEILKPFGAVPPLITDISLSVDDRWLLVSCWGTGELKRYDVSDPRNPRETGSVHLGGIVRRAPHPGHGGPLNGGPQMVETSRDGKRIFLTNSLYAAWDAQFYPEGIDGWLVKLDAGEDGSLTVDPDVFVTYSGERPHQVRLAGGDASSRLLLLPGLSDDGRRLALDPDGAARRLPRAQPGDGLAVRGGARHAGAPPLGGAARARADRARARAGDRGGRRARARPRAAGGLLARCTSAPGWR